MSDRDRSTGISVVPPAEETHRIELRSVSVETVCDRLEELFRARSASPSFAPSVRQIPVSPPGAHSNDEPTGTDDHDTSRGSIAEERLSITHASGETDGSITYKPYGPHGAFAVIAGAIFALPTVFLSLLVSLAGYVLYRIERDGTIPIEQGSTLDVVVRTDGTAEGDTVESGERVIVDIRREPWVAVDATRLESYAWSHRKGVIEHVREWSSRARDGSSHRATGDDVFFAYFTMCWKRDAGDDASTVTDLQREVFDHSDRASAYRELLVEEVVWETESESAEPVAPVDEFDDLLDELRRELDELTE